MATIPVKAEDDIRNRWFCNHQATMHDYTSAKGDKISVIDWRKPGTGVYSVRYLLDRNYLHVTGDCGDALYQLTEEATLERLAHYDMDYLFGKLRCMDSEGGLSFDTDTAVEGIRWFAKEYGEPQTSKAQECFNEVIEAAEECSSLSEWNQRLAVFDSSSYVFSDYFGTDWYEWMPSCGEVYSYQAVAFWLGLRMAYTQLHYGKEV